MISGMILAAGESSRMEGMLKPLLPVRGETFLEIICSRMWQAGVEELVVVLGANSKKILEGIVFSSEKTAYNRNYSKGQFSSLRAGIKSLDPSCEAVIVSLVDHPAVRARTYWRLMQAWRKAKDDIIVPSYNGQKGHPVVIPSVFFKRILKENMEKGLRALMEAEQERVSILDVQDRGVLIDVDTPDAYKDLLHGWA